MPRPQTQDYGNNHRLSQIDGSLYVHGHITPPRITVQSLWCREDTIRPRISV